MILDNIIEILRDTITTIKIALQDIKTTTTVEEAEVVAVAITIEIEKMEAAETPTSKKEATMTEIKAVMVTMENSVAAIKNVENSTTTTEVVVAIKVNLVIKTITMVEVIWVKTQNSEALRA